MLILRKRRLAYAGGLVLLVLVALALSGVDQATWRYVFSWDPVPSSLREAQGGDPGATAGVGGTPPTGTTGGGASITTAGEGQANFFAEFRLDRERARGQQLENLREMINNTKVDEATRRSAAAEWLALTRQIGKELEIEGLIKAKGWADCVVFLQTGACTVVVRADKLTQAEVARIGDIVVRGTGLAAQAISISARAL
jgi:stage III sporulation protein AH